MTLSEAQRKCREIEAQYGGNIKSCSWSEIYNCEEEMIADLSKVYVPKNRTAPQYTFIGYEYIYSFATQLQNGKSLSEKQITQCKRMAIQIKKAAAIADYHKERGIER